MTAKSLTQETDKSLDTSGAPATARMGVFASTAGQACAQKGLQSRLSGKKRGGLAGQPNVADKSGVWV